MQQKAIEPLWRDGARTVLASAALLTLLACIAGASWGYPYLQGFYFAHRAIGCTDPERYVWTDKLYKLRAKAAPACRWAYWKAGDVATKTDMARMLGYSAGPATLLDLVRQAGLDSPAEEGLCGVLVSRKPPPGAQILARAAPPAPEEPSTSRDSSPDLHYRFATYEVKVWDRGRSGYDCEIARIAPAGQEKVRRYAVHHGS